MTLGSRKIAAVIAAGAIAGGFGVGAATGAKRHHGTGLLLKAAAQYLQLDRSALVKDIRSGQTLAQIAAARGKSVDGLEAAMVAAVKTKLDAAVAAGKLSSTDEQARLGRAQKLVDRFVHAQLRARAGHAGKARLLGLAARYIGVTPRALAAELKGKSLAQVATAHGKTASGLKGALLKPFQARLAKAVAAGRISSADAQAKLAKISSKLDELIDKTR
jgi:hypothetical protein